MALVSASCLPCSLQSGGGNDADRLVSHPPFVLDTVAWRCESSLLLPSLRPAPQPSLTILLCHLNPTCMVGSITLHASLRRPSDTRCWPHGPCAIQVPALMRRHSAPRRPHPAARTPSAAASALWPPPPQRGGKSSALPAPASARSCRSGALCHAHPAARTRAAQRRLRPALSKGRGRASGVNVGCGPYQLGCQAAAAQLPQHSCRPRSRTSPALQPQPLSAGRSSRWPLRRGWRWGAALARTRRVHLHAGQEQAASLQASGSSRRRRRAR